MKASMPKHCFLRTLYAATFLISLASCDGGAPELSVSVRESAQGNVISIINSDRGALEIKDVIINDRDECTYVEPAPNSQTTPEFWLEGSNLDNEDRRQIWLQSTSTKDALVNSQDGKYTACKDVCPEGYESKGFSYITSRNACSRGSEYINGTTLCRKVSVGRFDKIILKVGDQKRWTVNARCQKVVRARVITDKGTREYAFTN